MLSFCRKNNVHKILRFRGWGIFGLGGAEGGSADFIFMGARIFLINVTIGQACYGIAGPPNPGKCSGRCMGKCRAEVGCSGRCSGECSGGCSSSSFAQNSFPERERKEEEVQFPEHPTSARHFPKSEPPKRGRKTGGAKIVEKCRKYFDTF